MPLLTYPFNVRDSACIGPATDYIFTYFGVDSSSRFDFREWRKTNSQMQLKALPMCCKTIPTADSGAYAMEARDNMNTNKNSM